MESALNIFGEHIPKTYSDRMEYELLIVEMMRNEDYFMLSSKLVRCARSSGLSIRPLNANMLGSLICYLCKITDIDPVRNGLWFEMFINPELVSRPIFEFRVPVAHQNALVSRIGALHTGATIRPVPDGIELRFKSFVRNKDDGLGEEWPVAIIIKDKPVGQDIPSTLRKRVPFGNASGKVKQIIDETGLCLVYQEQIMSIATSVAWMRRGLAYQLQCVLSSGELAAISPLRQLFLTGCQYDGLSLAEAVRLFSWMQSQASNTISRAGNSLA